jgi:hypothetical protein
MLPCVEQRQIYVGTAEGQVLVFACDSDFAVTRWITLPDYPSAVTCLDMMTDVVLGDEKIGLGLGLLAVGTQEGALHIYRHDSLRLAGSIAKPRGEGGPSTALAHARLLAIATSPSLPLSLLTVDTHSRMLFWGFKVQPQSGKLTDFKLLFDGGRLRENDCLPAPQVRDAEAAARRKRAAELASAFGNPVPPAIKREGSSEPVQITALATLGGQLRCPEHALDLQPPEGPKAAAEVAALAAKAMGTSGAFEAGTMSGGMPAFVTQPGSAAAASGEPGEASENDEDSETDGDEDEAICRRLAGRPRTPVSKVARAAVADGCNLAWLGDSGGWIWCIDLAASAAEAESQQQASKELPSGHRLSVAAGARQRLPTLGWPSRRKTRPRCRSPAPTC